MDAIPYVFDSTPIAVEPVPNACVLFPIAVASIAPAVTELPLAINHHDVIFPAICNLLSVGFEVQIPIFHHVLNMFVLLVIREDQSRYGVAPSIPA